MVEIENISRKELLLKDLCGRLPYVVFMGYKEWNRVPYQLNCDEVQYAMMTDNWNDVPYLRPMSSMTEEELNEYRSYCRYHNIKGIVVYEDTYKSFDWLNKKMFDYRYLIPKGLALEAHKGMYK